MNHGSGSERADSEFVDQLATALELVIRRLRSLAAAGEVSPTAAAVMTTLQTGGSTRITDLARAQRISQPAVTQLIGRMEADGLVRRETVEADRRTTLVTLTLHGSAVIEARRVQRRDALDALLGELHEADRLAIEAALPGLERLAVVPLPQDGATDNRQERSSNDASHS